MDLYYDEIGKRYVLNCHFNQRDIAKRHGFAWEPASKKWWTRDDSRALALFRFARNPKTRDRLENVAKGVRERSSQRYIESTAHIPLSAWALRHGADYKPHQRAAIVAVHDLLVNKPHEINAVLIADDAGVGKTLEFIGAMNILRPKKTLIVTTRTMKLNWALELSRWAVDDYRVEIYRPTGIFVQHHGEQGVVKIINYQLLPKYHDELANAGFDMLCADEAHLVCNPETKRAQALQGIRAQYEVFMTASPLMNRPKEFFPLLQRCAPKQFPDFHSYGVRYCDGKIQRWAGKEQWNYNGATHCEELGRTARSLFMIRRIKSELPHLELPAKIRRPIIFENEGMKRFIKREESLLYRIAQLKDDIKKNSLSSLGKHLTSSRKLAFEELATARKETAIAKIPLAIEHIENALLQEEKVIAFAHHHAVLEPLFRHFDQQAVLIWGKDKNEARRHAAVHAFQNDPAKRLFLGNIEAAGVGITLTKSPHVIFVELDWRPFIMLQAEDRAHRIGSDHDHLLIEYLLVEGSSDARMIEALIEKEIVAERILANPEYKVPFTMSEADYLMRA